MYILAHINLNYVVPGYSIPHVPVYKLLIINEAKQAKSYYYSYFDNRFIWNVSELTLVNHIVMELTC